MGVLRVDPSEQFSTRLTTEGRRVRIDVIGEVDLDSGDQLVGTARSGLALLEDGSRPEEIVIDLSQVSFMDSSGLLAVLRCREVVEVRGATLRVVVPGGPIARLFEVAGVTGWLDRG